ncbi:MAG TPA: hypothetical protein VNO23_18975 [Candidatus Binatia bacterium]|nr:hypothetical protein [Candidatus Binatia bacterium]
MKGFFTILVTTLLATSVAAADEAPIAGTVKAVDPAARTLTLAVNSRGKTREVTLHLKAGGRVVKFVRPTEPGQPGFVEQEVRLADVKPGWVVSAATSHEGDREVADVVRVVLER